MGAVLLLVVLHELTIASAHRDTEPEPARVGAACLVDEGPETPALVRGGEVVRVHARALAARCDDAMLGKRAVGVLPGLWIG